MQTELLQKDLKTVGEAISHELGAQMVKDYQAANPNDVKNYYVGRNIIDQVLAQPGCVGMRFYNAYNEKGEKTLVYVGVDAAGKDIIKYSVVDASGTIVAEDAIVADRSEVGNANWWDWFTEGISEIFS